MPPAPRPFVFQLTEAEANEITGASGAGGHQSLHRRLVGQLLNGNLQIALTDRELGELIRYMTQYGQGGFQGRLHRAFIRSIRGLLNI
jgi:hypothetical protein